MKDIQVGQRIGKLVIVKRQSVYNKSTNPRWVCKCDCGETIVLVQSKLLSGDFTSCKCDDVDAQELLRTSIHTKDHTGVVIGMLTVIRPYAVEHMKNGATHVALNWICRCECGNLAANDMGTIKKSKSCGCYYQTPVHTTNYKHGRNAMYK